jgi:homoserine O-succinyltransferase/O-acetyltransferase
MPLMIDGGRIPPKWAEKTGWRAGLSADISDTRECTKIAFINNMPDAALEDTELQFFGLLNAAAEDRTVILKLFSLPKVPRSDRGQEHLSSFYFGIEDLLSSQFDGVIITGTEPRDPDLRKEPYWSRLADVLDWAEENTASTVLSCLAAHAGVLHSDGIGRHALDDKQFGVFDDRRVADHVLMSGTSEPMRFPHSRWNEVREDALTSCGYTVLTKSVEAGVNLFVKKKRKSLFVHFQGHPEYGAGTLLKEYRRDIRRFLRRERPTYPKMPHGYFGAPATKLLDDFRETALSRQSEELIAEFPEVAMGNGLESAWHSAAARVYRNWLQYVVARRTNVAVYAASLPARISVTWSR